MPPDDPDELLHAAYTAIGKAVADFSTVLMGYVSDLDACDREYAENLLMPLLRVTRAKANRLLDRASDLTTRPAVLQALVSGRVDEGKA
uniref:hypothetical protein n=1 Tax=Allokutzneria sp. NRRL B-24872 TaxID=1137961 RepID=UPI001177E41D